jgi:hypothetical protein
MRIVNAKQHKLVMPEADHSKPTKSQRKMSITCTSRTKSNVDLLRLVSCQSLANTSKIGRRCSDIERLKLVDDIAAEQKK